MAEELEIQIPWMRYDLTLPLIEGRVPIEGVKLVPNRLAPAGTVFGPDSPLTRGFRPRRPQHGQLAACDRA